MILLLQKFNLEKTYQYLLIALAFLMPLTVAGANLIVVIIVFLWLFSGDYKKKFNEIINSKLMIASIVFYFIHVIGMLWTQDFQWGLHILHKMWYFLLLWPVLFTIVNKEYTKYYIYAFLLAMAFTEILSYLIWFEVIPPFKNATSASNPTPFMSHISFNPFLAFSIYLVTHEILFNKKLNKLMLGLYSFFSVAMVCNMFITGGRAGQVVFFVMIMILIIQYFKEQRIKALIVILILLPGIFITAYQVSPLFNDRVNMAYQELVNYDKKTVATQQSVVSSVGVRILFSLNSWQIIKENPLLGAGTGDFPSEYKKITVLRSPMGPYANNPHNMYVLVLVQSGIVGLLSMLSIIYYQITLSFKESNRFFRDMGLALPILFLVIMLSDSYLLGHYTGLLFIFFSSFLYKGFDKS
jgi:O-antigen ligase